MTQVNLLPVEIRSEQRTRRITIMVLAAAAAVVMLLVFVFALQSGKLRKADQALAAQAALNSGLSARIAKLEPYQNLKQRLTEREALVAQLLQGEVHWSGALQDLANVTPVGVSYLGMNATLTSTSTVPAPGAATSMIIGSIQFQGIAEDMPHVALILTRLEAIKGWVNAWISAANSTDTTGSDGSDSAGQATTGVQFSASVDFTTDATSQRSAG